MNFQNKLEALVIHHFLTLNNNTSPAIALLLEIKTGRVNRILTKYLNTKKINEQ